MLKAVKWLVIIVVGGFIALLALGMVIEANKTPEEKAADDARRAAEKDKKEAEEATKKATQAAEAATKREALTEPSLESGERLANEEAPDTEPEEAQSRVGSLVDRFKEMAADAEWQFTQQDSPFDGPVLETSKAFESESYAAEIAIQLRCVQAKRELSVTFVSQVYDSAGNTLPSSAFGNTWDISGQPFATQGRVKWANKQPQQFMAMLGEHSNVATLDTDKIVEAAGVKEASPSGALELLLPAHFELSNGAGALTLSVPANNSSINKVLTACK